jgi:hypothetical protein
MEKIYKFTRTTLLLFLLLFLGLSLVAQENRSMDGYGNNPNYPAWGAKGTNQRLMTPVGFADLISEPGGQDRPNPRVISNLIFHQDNSLPDATGLSDFAWLWGQFIDHDITLGPEDPNQPMSIPIPMGDRFFDPDSTGQAALHTLRSAYDPNTGSGVYDPRRFPNEISAFIDGSGVYGSDLERSLKLRTFIGGKLKTSAGNMLPYNTYNGEYDAPVDPTSPGMAMVSPYIKKWYIAGDVRANENILLTAMHTLFVREHNRVADEVALENPHWTDEQIYQKTRKIVGGIIQAIAYEEWLPVLGVELPPYTGYDTTDNPGIMNVFATAAYRYGHTVINSTIIRMDNDGYIMPEGNITLKEAFFNPPMLEESGGLDPLFNGMATQIEQDFDTKMITDLRNFLFGPPGAGGLDLAALNINRGRERGLADYNSIRMAFGLNYKSSFDEITSNEELSNLLEVAYGDVNNIDPWVGFLAEEHMPNTLFGETVMYIMWRQFKNLRSGDRFYYENDNGLTVEEIDEIRNTRLADVIRRNTSIAGIQDDVFMAAEHTTATVAYQGQAFDMTVYPNPGKERFQIMIETAEQGNGALEIFDLFGRQLMSNEVYVQNGENIYEVFLGNEYASGRYHARLTINNQVAQVPLVKSE